MTRDRRAALVVVCAAAAWVGLVSAHAFTGATPWRAPILDAPIHGLPHWREALARALWAVLGAATTWLAAWQCGRTVLRLLAHQWRPQRLERALFTLAVGAVVLGGLLLCLAGVGAYRPRIVVALVGLLAVSRPRAMAEDLRATLALIGVRMRAVRAPALTDAAIGGALALALASSFVAALAPEVEYDALWYHLWLPTQWLAAGRLVDIVHEYVALYPGGWEILNGAAMAVGGATAAKLLHFTCLPLLAATAVALARRVAPDANPLLVAALVVLAPTAQWEATTAYVDLALAWFLALGIVGLLRFCERPGDRGWLIVSALVFGGALSIKHLGLVALAICGGAMGAYLWRQGTRARAIGSVAALLGAAFLIASPWYVRDLLASGNPVFPEMYRVFGARPDARWTPLTEAALGRFKARFGMGHAARLALLPWDLTTHAARFGGTLGPLFLMLAPAALLAPRRRLLGLLLLGSAAYAAVWASPFGSQQLRFLVPLVPALAVTAAAGAAALAQHARQISEKLVRVPAAIVAGLLLISLPPFVPWQETERRGWTGWLTHVPGPLPMAVVVGAESESAYLSRVLPTFRAWQAIDAFTPPTARVLTFVGGDHLYSHRARLPADSAVAAPVAWGADAADPASMWCAVERLGISHVLFDQQAFNDPVFLSLPLVAETRRDGRLSLFYSDSRIAVYAVRDPQPLTCPSPLLQR